MRQSVPVQIAVLSFWLCANACGTSSTATTDDVAAGTDALANDVTATDAAAVADAYTPTCNATQGNASVKVVQTGCKALYDAFPQGIPSDPIKIVGAVPVEELCKCVAAFQYALGQCSFPDMVAYGLAGVPPELVDKLSMAASVCGGSGDQCPKPDEFVTDDIDPVRDWWATYQGYGTVPSSTLGAYLSWPCYSFYEVYADPKDPSKGIIDYPWMWDEKANKWVTLPISTMQTVTPGHFALQYENSTVKLDIMMWRGGPDWYFDYYCFPDKEGKILSEHIEIITVKGTLPSDYQQTIIDKMGKKGFDAKKRLIPRIQDFKWTCPALTFPDPNGK
jgi:hypothetical protein